MRLAMESMDSDAPPMKPANRAIIFLLVAGAALLAFIVVRLIASDDTDTPSPARTDSVPAQR
jgi:hypothetical protein